MVWIAISTNKNCAWIDRQNTPVLSPCKINCCCNGLVDGRVVFFRGIEMTLQKEAKHIRLALTRALRRRSLHHSGIGVVHDHLLDNDFLCIHGIDEESGPHRSHVVMNSIGNSRWTELPRSTHQSHGQEGDLSSSREAATEVCHLYSLKRNRNRARQSPYFIKLSFVH